MLQPVSADPQGQEKSGTFLPTAAGGVASVLAACRCASGRFGRLGQDAGLKGSPRHVVGVEEGWDPRFRTHDVIHTISYEGTHLVLLCSGVLGRLTFYFKQNET